MRPVADFASAIGVRLYRERLAAVERQIATRLETGEGDSPFRSMERRFVIAHAPRVGSHLLCEGLSVHGARVEEYFEVGRIHREAARNDLGDLRRYCRWLLTTRAPDGIFGVSGGVKALAPMTLTGELPRFAAEWRFVFLTRVDFVAQAVSELIARRSRAFKSTATPFRAVTEADYDTVRLMRLVDAGFTVNAAWEGAFRVLGVAPFRLTYEALAADPARMSTQVSEHLGLAAPVGGGAPTFEPSLRRQATALNQAWITRFRAEQGDFCRSREAGDFEPQEARRPGPDGRPRG